MPPVLKRQKHCQQIWRPCHQRWPGWPWKKLGAPSLPQPGEEPCADVFLAVRPWDFALVACRSPRCIRSFRCRSRASNSAFSKLPRLGVPTAHRGLNCNRCRSCSAIPVQGLVCYARKGGLQLPCCGDRFRRSRPTVPDYAWHLDIGVLGNRRSSISCLQADDGLITFVQALRQSNHDVLTIPKGDPSSDEE